MNAILNTEYARRDRQIPGVSLISDEELRILDNLPADDQTLTAILTAKAVFGGMIMGITEQEKMLRR